MTSLGDNITGREKLEQIKLKHLPKGSDAWATCGDKTLLEIARAKLLRYLLQIDTLFDRQETSLPDLDDLEDAVLYLCQLLDRYSGNPHGEKA